MTSNFKIVFHRSSDNLHLKLTGDFDSSSAHELIEVLRRNWSGPNKVIIHTSSLKAIHPFGRDTFQKNMTDLKDYSARMVFTGENAKELAPLANTRCLCQCRSKTSFASCKPAIICTHFMKAKRGDTIHIWNALFGRLSTQYLQPDEILTLIKDVLSIIGDGGHFTSAFVNQQLQILGWRGAVLDQISFELILFSQKTNMHLKSKSITSTDRHLPISVNRGLSMVRGHNRDVWNVDFKKNGLL